VAKAAARQLADMPEAYGDSAFVAHDTVLGSKKSSEGWK
jgi:hypothetical protein